MGVDAGPNCPGGYTLLPDARVTQAIRDRSVALLKQWRAGNFPVGSTNSEETTSGLSLDYRYEWHPPDFQNPAKHTGVTVYYCAGAPAPGGGTPVQPPLAPSSPAPSPSGSSGEASPSQPTSSDAAPGSASGDAANGAGACVAEDGSIKFSLEGLIEAIIGDVKKVL